MPPWLSGQDNSIIMSHLDQTIASTVQSGIKIMCLNRVIECTAFHTGRKTELSVSGQVFVKLSHAACGQSIHMGDTCSSINQPDLVISGRLDAGHTPHGVVCLL